MSAESCVGEREKNPSSAADQVRGRPLDQIKTSMGLRAIETQPRRGCICSKQIFLSSVRVGGPLDSEHCILGSCSQEEAICVAGRGKRKAGDK